MQFSAVDTENQINRVCFLQNSPKASVKNRFVARNNKPKNRYDLAKSPAVIGRFADDTSSQQSCRVRENFFGEISVDGASDGVENEVDLEVEETVETVAFFQSHESSYKVRK